MARKKRDPLDPTKSPKQRRSYIDYDYVNKLDSESRKFLETFTDEYYGGSFKRNPAYLLENGEFVQISENKERSKNRDLRKFKNVTLYYKDGKGKFTSDTRFKYHEDIIHKSDQDKKKLYRENYHRNYDISSAQIKDTSEDNVLSLELLSDVEYFDLESFDTIRGSLIETLGIMGIGFNSNNSFEDLIEIIGEFSDSDESEFIEILKEII